MLALELMILLAKSISHRYLSVDHTIPLAVLPAKYPVCHDCKQYLQIAICYIPDTVHEILQCWPLNTIIRHCAEVDEMHYCRL